MIESEKKQEFFKKNKGLVGPFRQLSKNVDSKVKIILVFGSFSVYSQTKDSDLDILFLVNGKIDENILQKEIERSFVTFTQEISPRDDNLNNFKRNINKGIYQTIVKDHIVIKGALDFIKLLIKK